MMSDITIVIPSLGNIKKLKKVVNSIFAQELGQITIEVIIIVNGLISEINEKNIKNYLSAFKAIKVIFLKEKGVNRARNYGLKNANSEIILFIDDDCEVENKLFLQKHFAFHQKHKQIFAYGGGYNLTASSKIWDKLYNYLQMKWLYSGVVDEKEQLVFVHHLLGGNFSIKTDLVKESGIEFDESIIYGGSEFEFFKRAINNNYSLVLNNYSVNHHTNESFVTVTRKLYNQGKGKAHIDLKYNSIDFKKSMPTQENIPRLQIAAMLYFNYVFWAGYYSYNNQSVKLVYHMFIDLIGFFNKIRFEILEKISQHLNYKKDHGDRF